MVTFVPLGNERKRLEMEHEMNVLRLILGQQRPQTCNAWSVFPKRECFLLWSVLSRDVSHF